MPTKPTDLVKPWGTAGVYPVGNYPLLYPWGDPNPLGGTPVPWGGLARIDAGDITAFSANGFTPQLPDDPESYNRWLNTVYQNAAWVEAGTDTNDADAHIVETDLFGIVTAVAFESEFAYQGLGGTPAPLPQGATVDSGMTLTLTGDADIAGGAGSQVAPERTLVTERRWVDSTTILPAAPGRTRWNDTFYSVHDAAGNVHTFDEPSHGYDLQHIAVNPIDSTAATCQRRIKHNETVWVTITTKFEGTVALSFMNYRIQATGPLGTIDIVLDTASITTANHGYFMTDTLEWIPTDTWPGELAIQSYIFLLRAGVTGGTLTADRMTIKVVSAVQV